MVLKAVPNVFGVAFSLFAANCGKAEGQSLDM
jgi:hypothetical protein